MRESGAKVAVGERVQLVSIGAFREKTGAVIQVAAEAWGLALRDGPFRACGANVDVLGIGPRRWLCVRYAGEPGLAMDVEQIFAGLVAVNDHSDAYVVVEVSGEGAQSWLAKRIAVDVCPEAFTTASVAVTTSAHTNVVLWRRDCDDRVPVFCVAVPRSYSESWLTVA